MTATHRIALDPTRKQETALRRHAGYARFAWNWGVEETRRALDAGEKGATSHYRLRPLWNAVKDEAAPWCREQSQNAAKFALIDLGEAWDRCFHKKARRPRFHSRKRSAPAFRADNGPDTVRTEGRSVRLPKIGSIRTREAARFDGPARECTVKHDGRRWFACCVYELPDAPAKTDGAVVGVDVGLRRLATIHDGERTEAVENPRPLRTALKRLRRLDRRIARSIRVHGRACSNRRQALYERRKRLHARIRDIRRDAAHKATTAIAKRSSVVCVETLSVSGWLRNRSLARSTADAAPGQFLSLLAWKCRREGARLVAADRWYPSSKTCSACGERNGGLRMEARWECPACGVEHDRDANAAVNLRRLGQPSSNVEAAEDPASAGRRPAKRESDGLSQVA